MRLRYVKGARDLIEQHPELIIDDKTHQPLNIESMFKKPQPLHVEIGMGKGQFIYELATNYPDVNFIGIEKFDSAIVRALDKVIENPLDNLYLLRADAMFLPQLLHPHSVERIYLNFSDPWPKERHAKRRLTNKRFLKIFETLLIKDGEIHFKTDNVELFQYSVNTMEQYPMELLLTDYDLHSHPVYDNIMTEFEEKFVEEGKPIHKLIARFKEEHNG